MESPVYGFLTSVLGQDAAQALAKAAERSPALHNVLLPRSVIAWLELHPNYRGNVPGVDRSYLELHKNEDFYTGAVQIGQKTFDFNQVGLLHVAACVSVLLGADPEVMDARMRKSEVQALGSNIDLLVKTRFLNEIQKAEESSEESLEKEDKKPGMGHKSGVALPGQAAAPVQPEKHKAGPVTQQQDRPPTPAERKERQMMARKSEAQMPCTVCEAPQFDKNQFVGCFCMRDLAPFAKSEQTDSGYLITFGQEWSDIDIALFRDILKGHE